jgi:uncharacterized protein with FMN-binding domain
MRRALTAVFGAAALALPVVETAQAATKSKVTVVKKTVTGSDAQAGRWGTIRVTLVVKKTTTVTGTKKKVTRSIVGVNVPVYPNHTDRSVYINQQALPYLVQETLQAKMNPNIQLVSGATDTSSAFVQSLQSAILLAQKV